MNLLNYPEIMTLEEVAEYLRCNERTIANWAADGKMPAGKIGTSWRFKRSDIQKWVNSQIGFDKGPDSSVVVSELFSPDRVLVTDLDKKTDILNLLIGKLTETPLVRDPEELKEAIFRRERLMSTGIGMRLAVPHVRLNSVTDIAATCALARTSVTDYESIDGEPVRLVVMIIAREDQHADHIRTLSYLCRRMKDPEIQDKLSSCQDSDELYRIIV